MSALREYPHHPGVRPNAPSTSTDAARAIASTAANLRARVLECIAAAGSRGLTADEAADRLGQPILSVRPRVSELGKADQIERTGERRLNTSGLRATVWRVRSAHGDTA